MAFGAHQAKPSVEARFTDLTENCYTTNQSQRKYLPDYATQRVLRWLLEGGRFDRVFLAKKAVQDYVFTDGTADKSIERKFAEDLDAADEVCVYAKLPRAFQIPTPVGNYSPDWAIAFYEGTVKHIFFVAETKGSMESLELRPIEQAKIACAKKLFRGISTNKVVYHEVDSYQNLLAIMKSVETSLELREIGNMMR